MKKSDLGIGLYLLAAIVFMIISVPSSLLDVLLALNIFTALVVLFNSFFYQNYFNWALDYFFLLPP